MFDIQKIIQELAKKRPVFHSEADFQHALAWEIRTHYPNSKTRLEKRYDLIINEPYYVDLVVEIDSQMIAIELKYKTKKSVFEFDDEIFSLRSHNAQDCGRYDFIKDICRLENIVKYKKSVLKNKNITCYAIFLTNDLSYKKERSINSVDYEFSIHQNRNLFGVLKWSELASAGTTKGRDRPLILEFNYNLIWGKYSELDKQTFEYLLIEIKP